MQQARDSAVSFYLNLAAVNDLVRERRERRLKSVEQFFNLYRTLACC